MCFFVRTHELLRIPSRAHHSQMRYDWPSIDLSVVSKELFLCGVMCLQSICCRWGVPSRHSPICQNRKSCHPIQQKLKTPKSTIPMSQESAQTNSKLPPALSGTNSFLARSTGVTTTTQDKGENTALTYVWCDTIHLSSISYSIRHTRVHCCNFDNKIGVGDSHTSISFVH